MKPNETRNRLGNNAPLPARGPLGAAFALVTSAVLLVLGVTFSLVFLAIIAVIGLLGLGYLWWKTRALRRHLRKHMDGQAQYAEPAAQPTDDGQIIEGVILGEERETPR